MREVRGRVSDQSITIALSGRIDSGNAREAEREIARVTAGGQALPVELDAGELEYISSAGLRILLHLRRTNPDLRITNVNSEVYETLDTTGFTRMIKVEKAYRVVSVEGCEAVGRGANSTIYRIDRDNVVKVYNNADALADIRHERELARLALVLGIPTAISYDVVRVGDGYGAVFELLNARSFSRILADSPEKWDWCIREYTELLKTIHATVVPEGMLPDMRETALEWAESLRGFLPEGEAAKLVSLIGAIPRDCRMLHGDYHTNNLELQDGEVLLIDMETLAAGHPIFELGSIYNAYVGYSEYDHEEIRRFLGIDRASGIRFWRRVLAAYLETEDPRVLREVTDKARIIGYTRMIRRYLRRGDAETERGREELRLRKAELTDLLGRIDTLLFPLPEHPLREAAGPDLRRITE